MEPRLVFEEWHIPYLAIHFFSEILMFRIELLHAFKKIDNSQYGST